MIARIFLFVVLASALLEGEACDENCKKEKGEEIAKVMKIIKECKEEVGLPDASMEKMMKMEIINSTEGQKMYVCVNKKTGIMNEKGEITEKCEGEIEKYSQYISEYTEKMKACCAGARAIQSKGSEEATALNIAECTTSLVKEILEKKKKKEE